MMWCNKEFFWTRSENNLYFTTVKTQFLQTTGRLFPYFSAGFKKKKLASLSYFCFSVSTLRRWLRRECHRPRSQLFLQLCLFPGSLEVVKKGWLRAEERETRLEASYSSNVSTRLKKLWWSLPWDIRYFWKNKKTNKQRSFVVLLKWSTRRKKQQQKECRASLSVVCIWFSHSVRTWSVHSSLDAHDRSTSVS